MNTTGTAPDGQSGTDRPGAPAADDGATPGDRPHARARSRPLRRRRTAVIGVAVGAALVAGAGLAASTLVRSPEQVAADTRPPAASTMTAPVVQRVLANTTVLRGSFAAGQTFQVQPATVAASAGGPGGGTPIVSALKAGPGDTVESRRVVAEVSGRPVFVLPGSVPAYRDMQPGESGADIAQLQKVLGDLGISTGHDTRGSFGAGTKTAVTKLYQQLGYPVPITGETTAAAVRTAQQAVRQQEQAVADLEHGAAAPTGDKASGAPAGDTATQLRRARDQLRQSRQELAEAQAKDGPQVPLSEVLFLPSTPARVAAVPAKVGDKVTGPVMTLTAGGLTLTGRLLPGDAPLVKPGMKVTVLSETSGERMTGTVGSVGAPVTPGAADGTSTARPGQAAGDPYVPVTVTPDEAWSPALEGQEVRITVVEAATQGEVLAVPASAVSSAVDGRTTVTVVAADGSRRPVDVTAGVVADNYVQVTAAGGTLKAGDQVLVGVAEGAPPAAGPASPAASGAGAADVGAG